MRNYQLKSIVFCFLFFVSITSSFAQINKNSFIKYIDSANNAFDENPKLARLYLDSIPQPVEKNIEGHVADYFKLRGIINDRFNNRAELFQNFLLALKYAKIENNYDIAGMASVELFYNKYFIQSDSISAFNYLNEAKVYYRKGNNINGLADVKQMYAYVQLNEGNYDKSNKLILQDLSEYKAIKDDGYYYMYALFMLSSNYIHQEDLYNSHKYFNRLKTLKKDTTITKYLHDIHKVSINTCIAEYHLSKRAIDSTWYYLKKSEELRYAMNNRDVKLYFKLYADYYKNLKDLESKESYIDSLSIFQDSLLEKNMIASVKINESLEKSEVFLDNEIRKKHTNRYVIGLLVVLLLVFTFIVIKKYKKIKIAILEYTKSDKEFTFLKSNHEKLKVKVRGLEDYIIEVKKEVKAISTIHNIAEQKEKIKELYKNIHHNSSTFLAKEENYLELINDLNIDFFTQMKTLHPKLNDSEITICYYLFIGFKNKEIAAFLNSSTRAIESKRYRISKKMDAIDNNATLVEYLNETFKETKTRSI